MVRKYNNKEIEDSLIRAFIKNCSEIHQLDCETICATKTEKPDFRLSDSKRTVGVEITRALNENLEMARDIRDKEFPGLCIDLRSIENIRQCSKKQSEKATRKEIKEEIPKLLKKQRDWLDKTIKQIRAVESSINSVTQSLGDEDIKNYDHFICAIQKELPDEEGQAFLLSDYWVDRYQRALPDGGNEVLQELRKFREDMEWKRYSGCMMGMYVDYKREENAVCLVKNAIEKKSEKYDTYKKYDANILLIHLDGLLKIPCVIHMLSEYVSENTMKFDWIVLKLEIRFYCFGENTIKECEIQGKFPKDYDSEVYNMQMHKA